MCQRKDAPQFPSIFARRISAPSIWLRITPRRLRKSGKTLQRKAANILHARQHLETRANENKNGEARTQLSYARHFSDLSEEHFLQPIIFHGPRLLGGGKRGRFIPFHLDTIDDRFPICPLSRGRMGARVGNIRSTLEKGKRRSRLPCLPFLFDPAPFAPGKSSDRPRPMNDIADWKRFAAVDPPRDRLEWRMKGLRTKDSAGWFGRWFSQGMKARRKLAIVSKMFFKYNPFCDLCWISIRRKESERGFKGYFLEISGGRTLST